MRLSLITNNRSSPKDRGGAAQSSRVQRAHRWHSILGLICGLNVILLSLTGAALVFHHEIEAAFSPGPDGAWESVPESGPERLEAVISRIRSLHPEREVVQLRFADSSGERATLRIGQKDDRIEYLLNVTRGAFARKSDANDWPDILWRLHATLFLGLYGQLYLGVIGVLFLASTCLGAYIYAPFMKGVLVGVIRRNGSARLAYADFHKLIGVASLAFNLLMAVTGILLTLGQIAIQIYSYQVVQQLDMRPGEAALPHVTLDQVLQEARAQEPDRWVRDVLYPGGIQGDQHFVALTLGEGVFASVTAGGSLIRASSGETELRIDLPWHLRVIAAAAPFHFGNFGGLGVRLLYCFLGLSSGALSATGFVMYFKRRRARTSADSTSRTKSDKTLERTVK